MKINKEGFGILTIAATLLIVANAVMYFMFAEDSPLVFFSLLAGSVFIFLFLLSFFRDPRREFVGFEDGMIVAPADGTVVVVEPTVENECLKEKCIQVSIFMSIFNVHANWYPTKGKIVHCTHNNGHFMSANLPKSSNENERSTILIETADKCRILMRQVAGALARRIVTYAEVGQDCAVNQKVGFIKFGSRVDLYLPLDAEIMVSLRQNVTGNQTVIAKLKKKD